jgi:prolyl oligopeptidase
MKGRWVIPAVAIAFVQACAVAHASGPDVSAASTSGARDSYSWLEGQHDPNAVEWARRRRDTAVGYLKSRPAFPVVERELQHALEIAAPLPELFVLGDRMVRFTRSVQHPAGLLEIAPRSTASGHGVWKTVLDLAALNRDEHSSYALNGLSFSDFPNRCLPPAFDRCLLPLSPGGSSNLELREFDLAKGAFVPDGFRVPANRSFTTWLNPDKLVIAHSLDGSPALPSNFPAVVRLWRRGTPLKEATPIFQAAPTDSLVDCRAIGLGSQRRAVLSVAHDYSTVEFKLVDQAGHVTDLDIPNKVKYVGNVVLSYPYVVVQLAQPAIVGGVDHPAESLIAYNIEAGIPAARRYSSVYVPPGSAFVSDWYTGLAATRSGIAFVEDRALVQSVWFARPGVKGWSTRKLVSAAAGTTLKIDSDRISDRLLLREEGFLTPPTDGLVALDGRLQPIQTGGSVADTGNYLTDVRSARSRDGTMVDYYLVRPRSAPTGVVPTLMGGYGSFGVNYAPSYFSGELKLGMVSWLSRGGAFVAAAIRGGGERGEAWHLGGAGLNKQHSFDDFIAVAEDLVRSGFTSPEKLGAFGRSAGGLLTAVMVTQRPDLFRAILVGVPVTDVAHMGAGTGIVQGQKAEFGDWDDPAQLPGILAWSPYQNIRPGVRYPQTLIITSTEDNQVGPGQARKFAARLEEVGAHPLLIEEATGGHGVPDQLRQPDLVSAEITFFIDNLMH